MTKKKLRTIGKLLIFRDSPIHSPSSFWLLGISGIIYFIFAAASSDSVLKSVSLNLFWMLFTFAYLKMYECKNRFVQTMTSLFFIAIMMLLFKLVVTIAAFLFLVFFTPTDLLIVDFINLFLFSLSSNSSLMAILSNKLIIFPFILITFIYLWEFLVITYIYKQALLVNNLIGLFITLQLFLINILISLI